MSHSSKRLSHASDLVIVVRAHHVSQMAKSSMYANEEWIAMSVMQELASHTGRSKVATIPALKRLLKELAGLGSEAKPFLGVIIVTITNAKSPSGVVDETVNNACYCEDATDNGTSRCEEVRQ